MGRELGGRTKITALLSDGKPDYAKMARDEAFLEAIARLIKQSARQRVALMCAERDPINCHRFLLIARHLASRGVGVNHILSDGQIENHTDTERRMIGTKSQADLFE